MLTRRALLMLLVLLVPCVIVRGAEPAKDPFAKWEHYMVRFEAADKANPPAGGGVVFYGSSSIVKWDLKKSELPGVNRGFGGSQIFECTHFLDRAVVPQKPRVIVFYAGDNDTAAGKKADRVLADFKAFVAAVHQKLPGTRVIWLPIKPSVRRVNLMGVQKEANAAVSAFIKTDPLLSELDTVTPMLDKEGKPRAELFISDGLHMNDKGYAIWNALVKPAIEQAMK